MLGRQTWHSCDQTSTEHDKHICSKVCSYQSSFVVLAHWDHAGVMSRAVWVRARDVSKAPTELNTTNHVNKKHSTLICDQFSNTILANNQPIGNKERSMSYRVLSFGAPTVPAWVKKRSPERYTDDSSKITRFQSQINTYMTVPITSTGKNVGEYHCNGMVQQTCMERLS